VNEPAKFPVRTPAVVIGADTGALGVVRSLGRGGVPVIVVNDDARCPAMHSRYARPFLVDSISGLALVDGLLDLAACLNAQPVLFPTSDTHVRTISEYRERLEKAFRFRLPDHRRVCELLHKSGVQHLSEKHGFPMPRAVAVCCERDFEGLSEIRFPAVVKPGTKELISRDRAPRACQVSSRDEAEAVCREILPRAPDLIVQEWIEGAESEIHFCLQFRGDEGITVSSFTGRKLRSWPPQTGSTASCMAAPEVASMLEPLTTAFFNAVQSVGMCSMEFKRDRRSGQFFMIEPTIGRTDWQEEVATLHGINIPLTAYCYELGLPVPMAELSPGPVIWRDPPAYWRSVLATQSTRDEAPAGAIVKSACWRFEDPMPLVYFWFEWIRELRSPGRWARLMAVLRPSLDAGPGGKRSGHQRRCRTETSSSPSVQPHELPSPPGEPKPVTSEWSKRCRKRSLSWISMLSLRGFGRISRRLLPACWRTASTSWDPRLQSLNGASPSSRERGTR
jgi:predicted ATP-grasp superfamily ATP-dependent carboligase